ncbi:TPA: hypothetical protein DCX16_02350 [bacterium]|nr:hypothetical protein [bacterium]
MPEKWTETELFNLLKEQEYLGTLASLYSPRFAHHFLEILSHITLAQKFIRDTLNKNDINIDLYLQWSAIGVFEGFPSLFKLKDDEPSALFELTQRKNMGCLINLNVAKLKSLIEMSFLLKQACCLSPRRSCGFLLTAVNSFCGKVSKLASKILKSSTEQMQEGLIIFLDITKTTPAIIDAEKQHRLAEYNTKMQCIFREIASTILLCESNTKYWLLGGDSFISFSVLNVSNEKKIGSSLHRIITEIKRKLKEIAEDEGVFFNGGAHFGKFSWLGDKTYVNLDFIKAVRAQELCQKDGEVIITHKVKEKIEKTLEEEKREEIFEKPEVLYEGKHIWIQPNRLYIQFGDEEIDLFTIKEGN